MGSYYNYSFKYDQKVALREFTFDHRARFTSKLDKKTDVYMSGETELQKIKKIIGDPNNTDLLKKFGFYDKNPDRVTLPTYTLNQYGYRCDEFNSTEDRIVTLGCSDTFGAYQYQERTWPYFLSKSLNKKVWNLGSCGASIQSCYTTFKAIESKIKFSEVFLLIPNPSRFVFYNFKKGFLNVHGDDLDKFSEQFSIFKGLGFDQKTIDDLKIYFTLMISDPKWKAINITTYLDAINGIAYKHKARVHYLFNFPFFPHPYSLTDVDGDVFTSRALDLRHSGSLYQREVAKLFTKIVGNSNFNSYI